MRMAHTIVVIVAPIALFTVACEGDPKAEKPYAGSSGSGSSGGSSTEDASTGVGVDDTGSSGDIGTGSDTGGDTASSDSDGGLPGDRGAGADAGLAEEDASTADSGDPDFDACYAQLKPNCVASEMDTPERMETPCKSLTNIPVPLSDGTTHGPVTIEGGPYGGKVEWNEGADTEFVNPINLGESTCVPFAIDTFNEPAAVTDELKNLRDVDWGLYTIFRPACFKAGETYPVITWANGTCGEIHGYSALLSMLASHGYVVVASNSTWTATPPTNTVQLRALDYAKALNEDPDSVLYQRLDMDNIGAMGHSQGAGATSNADDDPRIKAVILWNAGNSDSKPYLNVSGERDIGGVTPDSMASEAEAASQPGAWVYFRQVLQTGGNSTGHLTLMEQPERVVDLALAWWDWRLKGDEDARKMFVGDDCGLCNRSDELEFGHNSLLE